MIIVNEQEKVFHLNNGRISYLLYIMESGQLGHLYFGQALNTNGSYLHMVEKSAPPYDNLHKRRRFVYLL